MTASLWDCFPVRGFAFRLCRTGKEHEADSPSSVNAFPCDDSVQVLLFM